MLLTQGLKNTKLILAILILAASAISSNAALYTETTFDGYALEYTIYETSSGQKFEVEFTSESKVVFDIDGRAAVEQNDCSQTASHQVCFEGYSFSHYNYSLPDRIVNKAKIRISKMLKNINLTREMDSEMLIGKSYNVKTTMHNDGEHDISGVVFSDFYSWDFDVYLTSNCEILQNNITWKGRLEPNQKKSCSYVVRPLKSTNYQSEAIVDYEDSTRKRKSDVKQIVVVPYSLQSSISIENNTELGSELHMNITVLALKNITVEYFRIKIPPGMKPIKTDNQLERTSTSLTFRGRIAEGEKKNFSNTFLAESAGASTFEINSRFKVLDFQQDISEKHLTNVTFEKPTVRLVRSNFSKNQEKLTVFISNPSSYSYTDVSLVMKGFIDTNITIPKLEGLSHKEYSYDFSRVDGDYNLDLYFRYMTQYGQRLSDIKREKVKINTLVKEEQAEQQIPTQSNATKDEKNLEVDVGKGIRQSSNLFLILAGSILLTIILGLAAARLRRTKPPENEPEPTQPLNDGNI